MREVQKERREKFLSLLNQWGCLDKLTDSEKERINDSLKWLTEQAINDFQKEINKI
tara:strand:+ start:290 stop:457 length:168 start_codon:yes stop_codon:yes gene_type:complete